MVSVYVWLTTLLCFLPSSVFYFNNSFSNPPIPKEIVNATPTACQQHTCALHHHAAQQQNRIAFGEDLGKYIKETVIRNNSYKIQTIVIDPGHGGKDPGCLGTFTQEKDIALNISLKLGKAIKELYPHINVIYTRSTDVFIPLYKRASIANQNDADLFMSVHCNFSELSNLTVGTETYIMGLHTANYNLNVAKRENRSILLEEDYKENYGGYDPNSPEGHIILSMFQNTFLEQSILFAEKVESTFRKKSNRESRGVKQAGFAVLKGTTMPSVLIETGFLSNLEEERFLSSDRGQRTIANSITGAFVAYKRGVEREPLTNEEPAKKLEKEEIPFLSAIPTPSSGKPPKKQKASNSTSQKQQISPPPSYTAAPIRYKVQLLVSDAPVQTDQANWKKLDYLVEIKMENDLYKYLATGFRSYEEASKAKKELRSVGFDQAFIVAYKKGKRIPIDQARKTEKDLSGS